MSTIYEECLALSGGEDNVNMMQLVECVSNNNQMVSFSPE
jgi:hypothetical protein